jgi:phosphoribosylaminoimidazolecarboxamide formyltransferase / IMP cyclohydrolase
VPEALPPAALLSLSDRTGLEPLARTLAGTGHRLIATSGTAAAIRALGLACDEVGALTGFPPLFGGRVKTLHPIIMGGLLADTQAPEHVAEMRAHGIPSISVVAVNLYPFERTVSRNGVTEMEAVEQIDIGGVTLLRAAAKNFARVSVLSDAHSFEEFARAAEGAGSTLEQRRRWAAAAFARCEEYDRAIARYFRKEECGMPDFSPALPESLHLDLPLAARLRYGENPWASAAFYGPTSLRQLSGKDMSYNNLLDIDSCLRLLAPIEQPSGFPPDARSHRRVRAAIVKHTVPCGIAARDSSGEALGAALGADPISAFGGIVACDAPIALDAAQLLHARFLEVIAAPAFAPDALALLQKKKNVRLLVFDPKTPAQLLAAPKIRSALGGVLVENPDPAAQPDAWRVVTQVQPTPAQWRDLLFGFAAVRHVKSNAAVVVADELTLGVCGGQTNRVAAVDIACQRAGSGVRGATLATDGFFPFADGIEAAARAGIAAVVAPSGSIRDEEVIAAARKAGVALIFTSRRYFLH